MLKLINVSKIYNMKKIGEVTALKNINLQINTGEFVAVIGASGSGKSTLMNILGGLDSPSSGEYYLDNALITNLTGDTLADIRCNNIGFIFQNFKLISKLTALENIMLPLMFLGMSKKDREETAMTTLKKVGLLHLAGNKPSEMSGGQQQRVAIARAIAGKPKIILADEPTGNLDPVSCVEILSLLKMLSREGHTVVMITHDMEIKKIASRFICIENGKIM